MVMIENADTDEVLMQNRCLSWCGYAFPGGHVENCESFYASAVRETKEETGLDVKNLKLCGIVHWSHKKDGTRYIVYLYKTSDFSGTLTPKTNEGSVQWIKKCNIKNLPLSPNMEKYLEIFMSDNFCEFFGLHDSDDRDITVFKC